MHDKRITLRRLAAVAIAAGLPVGATAPDLRAVDPIRIGLILP